MEIKTVLEPAGRFGQWLNQLLAYLLLDWFDTFRLDTVAVYLGWQAKLMAMSLTDLLTIASTVFGRARPAANSRYSSSNGTPTRTRPGGPATRIMRRPTSFMRILHLHEEQACQPVKIFMKITRISCKVVRSPDLPRRIFMRTRRVGRMPDAGWAGTAETPVARADPPDWAPDWLASVVVTGRVNAVLSRAAGRLL